MDRFQSRFGALGIVVVAVAALALSMVVLPAYSTFTAGALNAALVVLAALVFDAVVLRQSDTLTEIVIKKNVAYALFFGLVVVAMAIGISGA